MITPPDTPSSRRIPLTVNCEKTLSVYPGFTGEIIRKHEDLPALFYGEEIIFCIRFINGGDYIGWTRSKCGAERRSATPAHRLGPPRFSADMAA